MAAVPVTIIGTLTGKDGSENVTIIGMASLTGLSVGGGPITDEPHPEHPIAPGGKPPSIWPSPGHPAHPIVIPPDVWPTPPNPDGPHPEHPIVIPPPSELPGAPPLQVKVVWGPQVGWQVVLVPTGPHPSPSAAGGRRA